MRRLISASSNGVWAGLVHAATWLHLLLAWMMNMRQVKNPNIQISEAMNLLLVLLFALLLSAASAKRTLTLHQTSSTSYAIASQNEAVRGGPMCALCTFAIDEMKTALNSSTVQATIMEKSLEVSCNMLVHPSAPCLASSPASTQMCDSLPVDISSPCTDFVKTYGERLPRPPFLNSFLIAFFAQSQR